MQVDSYTEVTSEGWFSRIGKSIKGILVGIVMFFVAFPILWMNEGRAVQAAKSLEEGRGEVVSIEAASVDPENEGKLVHLSGEATTTETLSDPLLGLSEQALRLSRSVEMYQWTEQQESKTKKKLGGGKETTTTYTYKQTWSSRIEDSARFKRPAGHTNPPRMAYPSTTSVAKSVTLGAFNLTPALVARIHAEEAVALDAVPEALKDKAQLVQGGLYVGANPDSPVVGDLRIAVTKTPPTVVSVVSRQIKDTFEPYQAEAGDAIEMLEVGTVSAESMFASAEKANAVLTWILRLVGFLVMAFGIAMLFGPIVTIADVLPFLGTLIGIGVAFFAGAVALSLSLITIGLAWLFYRPLIGIPLLVLGIFEFIQFSKLADPATHQRSIGSTRMIGVFEICTILVGNLGSLVCGIIVLVNLDKLDDRR